MRCITCQEAAFNSPLTRFRVVSERPSILDLCHHVHFVVRDSHWQRVGLRSGKHLYRRAGRERVRRVPRLPVVEARSDFLWSPRRGPSQSGARLHRGVEGLVQVPDLRSLHHPFVPL